MGRSEQFFHGTTHPIVGDMIRPALKAGRQISEYTEGDPGTMSSGDHAFAIRNDETYAWHAAHTFHRNGKRPRVYEVEPAKDMKPGPWNNRHPDFMDHVRDTYQDEEDPRVLAGQDEWASKTGFKIKNQIDIMPGRQGTFPEINWNKHRQAGVGRLADANHPSDKDIHEGLGAALQRRNDETVRAIVARKANFAERKGRMLPIVPGARPATLFD